MTDGGHVPVEGQPEQPLGGATAPSLGGAAGPSLGAAEVPAGPHGEAVPGPDGLVHPAPPVTEGWPAEGRPAFTFLDEEEEDVLLMPGPQGSWGESLAPEALAEPADTMTLRTVEETGQPGTPVEPSWPPLAPPAAAAQPVTPAQAAPRRPLHAGPPIPDPSLMTGQVPVRSLADRGPSAPLSATPAHGTPVVPQPMAVPQPQEGFAAPATPAHGVPTAVPVAEAVVAPVPVDVPAAVPVDAVHAQGVPPQADFAAVPVAPQGEALAPQADLAAVPVPVQGEGFAAPGDLAPEAAARTVAPQAELPAESVEPAAAEPVAAEQTVAEPLAVEQAVAEPLAVDVVAFEAPAAPQGEAVTDPAATAAAQAVEAPVADGSAAPDAPAHVVPVPAQPAAEAVEQAVPVAGTEPQAVQVPAEPVAEQPVEAVVAESAEPAEAVAPAGQPEAEVEAEAGQPAVEPATAVEAPAAELPLQAVAEPSAEPVTEPVTEQFPAEAVVLAPAAEQAAAPVAVAVEQVAIPSQPRSRTSAFLDALAPQDLAVAQAPAAEAEPVAVAEQPEAEAVAPEAVELPETPEVLEPVDAEAEAEQEEAAECPGTAAPGFDQAGREAVHQVIRERRDIRNGFRPDPIPHEVLIRVLEAAHTAPSVGYSQPWDFVVIRSAKTRRRMHELAERQRNAYAESLPKGRAKQFKEIKIEAILETPVNIVVTADRTRGGRHTLGRHTQPQMAPYSAALAVENLWLAARAEGLGVGWVSFFDEEEMVRELGLPEHLDVVAYLCVGYVDAFPDEPELQQQGWAKKRPLSWVVHEEQYGNRALPGEEPHDLLSETLRGIRPLDAKALGDAWDRQKRMTKPAGSLGMLEIIAAQLSGLSRKCPPPIPEPGCVAIFAGDHGVHAQGVTPWPQEVTAQMVANFLAGGAVVNSFAAQVGAEVCVVDVGVASELPDAIQQGRTTGLLPRKVKPGTDDMTQGPAMTREEAQKAIEVGIETARDLVAAGNKVLITGDMGIANTTASAALISVFAGLDPAEVTGRGTGIDDEMHAHKVEVIRRALALHQPDPSDPIGVLAAVGGLEHAAIAGFLLGAASLRTPVILDGVIAGSAALVAKAIAPEVLAACIAGHRSAEPGHQAALARLGLRPLIDLDLRLGEGTGALLALPLVQSAARAMHDVATFDSAGVTEKA
ncbi:nicotinate-nucleotide--dimethylbenzimidazole phosphoribosyltransferase [Kitasatospora sp. NPDC002227]|uniref:nicotinate-nucleotide--dimethylbenzimidazole phosphoribosyltransferase n=1 Tax=Kitasatospora sp. NPDC002227 TaxID=3154773 RepID=UPI00332CF273